MNHNEATHAHEHADGIKERLAIRNLSHDLRSSGVRTAGPDKLTKQEIQSFSNQLDRVLSA